MLVALDFSFWSSFSGPHLREPVCSFCWASATEAVSSVEAGNTMLAPNPAKKSSFRREMASFMGNLPQPTIALAEVKSVRMNPA